LQPISCSVARSSQPAFSLLSVANCTHSGPHLQTRGLGCRRLHPRENTQCELVFWCPGKEAARFWSCWGVLSVSLPSSNEDAPIFCRWRKTTAFSVDNGTLRV
jgi:hypothetical protein